MFLLRNTLIDNFFCLNICLMIDEMLLISFRIILRLNMFLDKMLLMYFIVALYMKLILLYYWFF